MNKIAKSNFEFYELNSGERKGKVDWWHPQRWLIQLNNMQCFFLFFYLRRVQKLRVRTKIINTFRILVRTVQISGAPHYFN